MQAWRVAGMRQHTHHSARARVCVCVCVCASAHVCVCGWGGGHTRCGVLVWTGGALRGRSDKALGRTSRTPVHAHTPDSTCTPRHTRTHAHTHTRTHASDSNTAQKGTCTVLTRAPPALCVCAGCARVRAGCGSHFGGHTPHAARAPRLVCVAVRARARHGARGLRNLHPRHKPHRTRTHACARAHTHTHTHTHTQHTHTHTRTHAHACAPHTQLTCGPSL
jgi:hypothetical protein